MRRTKQESEATRQGILAAARRVFARCGVARASLEDVAAEAGVTRGAIYWHFANKSALFAAMREQVAVPLVDRTDFALLADGARDPLVSVEQFLRHLLDAVAADEVARQTFEILLLKCEYVGELATEVAHQAGKWRELEAKLRGVYARARRVGALRAGLSPAMAALGTCAFAAGLMRLWLLDEGSVLVRRRAGRLIAAHVASQRCVPRSAAAARP